MSPILMLICSHMIQLKILFTKKPSPALLGIYEEGPLLFLVSPFMTNGALHDWRKQHVPVRVDDTKAGTTLEELINNITDLR